MRKSGRFGTYFGRFNMTLAEKGAAGFGFALLSVVRL